MVRCCCSHTSLRSFISADWRAAARPREPSGFLTSPYAIPITMHQTVQTPKRITSIYTCNLNQKYLGPQVFKILSHVHSSLIPENPRYFPVLISDPHNPQQRTYYIVSQHQEITR
ncbi:hypothetical protein AAHE18_16G273400 [Arachis hypogaea]